MSKPLQAFSLTVGIVALSSLEMTSLHAMQQCSAAMPPNPQGQWWSYRFIDGRKCWYAGKPLLSKALLEWPIEQRPELGSRGEATGIVIANKPGNPFDAQTLALKKGSDTFEERWRARISSSNPAHD
ncbi:hypothetical protein QCM77_01910 [Bradyrhizobium sp. SSUT18]|uniref:hypothetical protein n=1 Tax=Bradyrhizobium sp. SSUT18 TaxID=3040602 RepID=UPI00244AFADE|nr:hypothetical protein [Bradyrhizobium sp. SSUT18]MDH2398744.1 hypothetical protein [Bradyrhizobium sp. SSUT18]